MRRALLFISLSLCGCAYQGLCEIDDCPPPADSCDGVCVPYVGGGWSPVLVPASTSSRVRCPEAAPFEAMTSATITVCGVREAPGTCGSQAFECLPEDPAWQACIVRDGEHDCPSPYPLAIDVTDAPVSLCCPRETPPA